MEEKSPYYTDEKVREKIDTYLAEMATFQTELGKNSTISEFKRVKKKQQARMKKIQKLDPEFYNEISPDED